MRTVRADRGPAHLPELAPLSQHRPHPHLHLLEGLQPASAQPRDLRSPPDCRGDRGARVGEAGGLSTTAVVGQSCKTPYYHEPRSDRKRQNRKYSSENMSPPPWILGGRIRKKKKKNKKTKQRYKCAKENTECKSGHST